MHHFSRALCDAISLVGGTEAAHQVSVRRIRRGEGPRGGAEWQSGDYTSAIAHTLASQRKQPPSMVAQRLQAAMLLPNASVHEEKGFLNVQLNEAELKSSVQRALDSGDRYGASDALQGESFNVEFVSADPTGPLSFEMGRSAAVGETICRLLEWQGASVTREYFLNDDETSHKLRLLGESISAFYLSALDGGGPMPEGSLRDQWVRDIGERIARNEGSAFRSLPNGERSLIFARRAREAAVASQRATLARFGVRFDNWTTETSLLSDGRVTSTITRLRERGYVTERDGALWLRTTAFGDAADRPLVRADGRPTYLAVDIAYHRQKLERGYARILDIWTAEHAPYVGRTRAALRAAGVNDSLVEVLLCVGAQASRDDSLVTHSIGSFGGGAFTLDEALQECDADTLRYFFLARPLNDTLELDLEFAAREDETNSAYAARLLPSRLRMLAEQAGIAQEIANPGIVSRADRPATTSEPERDLMRLVAVWPHEAQSAAHDRAPHRITAFLSDMVGAARQLARETNPGSVSPERANILRAAQITAANALRVLGLIPNAHF